MDDFTRKVPKVRAMLASFLAEGKADKAKTTANAFADNAVKSGFWTKGKNELIKPMLQSPQQDAQKMKAAPPIPDGATRGQNGVELPNIIALSAAFKRAEKEIKAAFKEKDGGLKKEKERAQGQERAPLRLCLAGWGDEGDEQKEGDQADEGLRHPGVILAT